MLHTREFVSEILTHKEACPIHSEEGEGEGGEGEGGLPSGKLSFGIISALRSETTK